MEVFVLNIFVGLLGLLVGSFLNVCIYRLPDGKSIAFPPSHCMECNTRLKVPDLIPVFSYIFLKGRCRYCNTKISARYPLVEIMTAVAFLLLFNRLGAVPEFIAAVFLISILIAVFFIDLDRMIIPDELVIAGLAGAAAATVIEAFTEIHFFWNLNWWDHLIGLLAGSGILFIISLVGSLILRTDEAIGMGDVKILAPIGMFLGWRLCIFNLLLSVIIGGITGMILIIFRIKKRRDAIPFGPFIVVATFITLLCGKEIIMWYLSSLM